MQMVISMGKHQADFAQWLLCKDLWEDTDLLGEEKELIVQGRLEPEWKESLTFVLSTMLILIQVVGVETEE